MFELDPRLENGSTQIAHWPLCDVRFKDNKHFPWVILIPRIADSIEIHTLRSDLQLQLTQEISKASRIMTEHFNPEKINVGALGNIVSQLHIHVVARFKTDALWPQGIWQEGAPDAAYDPESFTNTTKVLQELFS